MLLMEVCGGRHTTAPATFRHPSPVTANIKSSAEDKFPAPPQQKGAAGRHRTPLRLWRRAWGQYAARAGRGKACDALRNPTHRGCVLLRMYTAQRQGVALIEITPAESNWRAYEPPDAQGRPLPMLGVLSRKSYEAHGQSAWAYARGGRRRAPAKHIRRIPHYRKAARELGGRGRPIIAGIFTRRQFP